MELWRRQLLMISLSLSLAAPPARALAEDAKPDAGTVNTPSPSRLTGKERLGPKWTDEQRIDNCKVPRDKRGTKPRPTACPDAPPS